MRKVLTIGTFDIPHFGHAAFLARCAELGSLVVGVNSDAFVLRYRKVPPLYPQEERMSIIGALYPVIVNDGPGRDLIDGYRPDFLVVGTDWARRDYLAQIDVTQDWLDERGIAVVYMPGRTMSTSDIKARIA